ncbi:extracellular solute-binding protein [Paenibacillus chungangensis]|uniref:Extracellular solute-binding protein n=1 Tax=Paenibacillus chungangensis TaxID=696535 RepID=A0ABW3HRR6_9BACL
MEKKNLRTMRSLSLSFLVMTLLVSMLAACSGTNNGNGGSEKGSNNGTTTDSPAGAGANEVVELDIFIDQPWWPVKDFEGTVSQEITKRTGVKLNVTVATDEKQLPVMIASGELPDLVATSNQWMRMSNPDLSYDWNSLIEQYAPDFAIHSERIAVNTMEDGKFYTIRNNFSTTEEWENHKDYALLSGPGIAYRADLAKELGITEINTLDDFMNMLGAAKEKYPDMIPLVLNAFWKRHFFALQFGAAWDHFDEQDGKLVHALHTPNLEKAYLYMNEMYRKGYITAENYAIKNEDQTKAFATGGKAFAYTWTTNVADALNAETKEQGMEWASVPMKLSDEFRYIRMDTGWQGTFITKNNKNPEASIKFMQFLQSEEGQRLAFWGVEGVDYNMSEDGGYPIYTFNRQDAEEEGMRGLVWGMLGGSAVHELVGGYIPGTESTKSREQLMANTTFNWAMGMVKTPPADSEESIIAANIKTMMANEEAKIYLANSEEEAREAYASMVEKAEKMGLEKLVEWANVKYEEAMKLFQ